MFSLKRKAQPINPADFETSPRGQNPESFLPTIFKSKPSLRSISLDKPESIKDLTRDVQEIFKIRAAASQDRAQAASVLIKNRYSWRGYETGKAAAIGTFFFDPQLEAEVWKRKRNEVTLVAAEGNKTFGTITVRYDSPEGLACDELYHDELEQLRARGITLCEFTKLAMDNAVGSKHALGSIFHVAVIYAHLIRGCSDLVIEVNPRHVSFYKRLLHMEQLGPKKLCPRINAPAVLLHIPLSEAEKYIAKFGGQGEKAQNERSLYPYFFDEWDEAAIVARLLEFGEKR